MNKFSGLFIICIGFYSNCSDPAKECNTSVVYTLEKENCSNPIDNKASLRSQSQKEQKCAQFFKDHPIMHHALYGLAQFTVSLALNKLVATANHEILNRYGKQIQDCGLTAIPCMVNEACHGAIAGTPTTIASVFITEALFDKCNMPKPDNRHGTAFIPAGLGLGVNVYFYFDNKE